MSKALLTLTATLALGTLAQAQQDASSRVHIGAAVKDAGTYHVATGTWTRSKSPIAAIGTSVLYDNTCVTGPYYSGLSSGESMVDSGRIPSTTSPTNAQSLTGDANAYTVNGFQIGYCTGEPTITARVNFYECYVICTIGPTIAPTASITVPILPGTSGTTGSPACWIVTVDLDLTTQSFTMLADCSGTYNGIYSLDNFGWSFESLTPPTIGVATGPLIAGDPFGTVSGTACPYGDGTAWSGNTSPGTGMGSDDVYETAFGAAYAGCWFYGGYLTGNLYSSHYLQVIGDTTIPPPITGTNFCVGAPGSGCPCGNGNDGSNGPAGCGNGLYPGGALLSGTGTPSISAGTLLLSVTGVEPQQPGLFFRADNAINGGAGVAFGDGLRCAGGNLVRLGIVVSDLSGNADSSTLPAGVLAGLTPGTVRRFQYWYRNPNGSPCGTSFNLSNGFEITAMP